MSDLAHLSKSSMEAYMMCPRSWKYKYKIKPVTARSENLVFGIAFHSAMEKICRAMADGHSFSAEEFWADSWQESIDADSSTIMFLDRDPDEYEELGLRMILQSDLLPIMADMTPAMVKWEDDEGMEEMDWGIEYPVRFLNPNLPIPIIGYIDYLRDDFMPIDFKTSARKWNADKAAKEIQAKIYVAGLKWMGLPVPDAFTHIVVTKTKTPGVELWETPILQSEIDWVMKAAGDVYEAIAAERFPPNTMSWKCSPKYCEFYDFCMMGQPYMLKEDVQ
jgi:hypothetical protein